MCFWSSFLEYCTSKEHVILVKKLRTSKWDSEDKSKYAILQIALKASQWSTFRPPIKKIPKKVGGTYFFLKSNFPNFPLKLLRYLKILTNYA